MFIALIQKECFLSLENRIKYMLGVLRFDVSPNMCNIQIDFVVWLKAIENVKQDKVYLLFLLGLE